MVYVINIANGHTSLVKSCWQIMYNPIITIFIIQTCTDGIPCPDPPMVANSKQRYDESANGVFITYICDFAHHFPDRSTVKQIQCLLREGKWSNSLTDCEGKS